ncbi:MAG: LicD family protein, partial [Clostridia bacterium]|nr:LicD family protein [Clostridia bacterium]
MRPIKSEEVQPILLNILKAFKIYCDKNDVKFMLCGGTTLGAVRHKGFIP